MKLIKRVLIAIVIVLFVGLGFAYYHLEKKKAVRNGELKLSELKQKVEVIYDKWGVPHIFAQNETDLQRAFGYVHAQDRLFQMELMVRLAQGPLAEILGEKLVEVDRLFRTLQIYNFSKAWIDGLDKIKYNRLIGNLDAYIDGVNQYVKNGQRPLEFEVLGIPEREFTRADIASIVGYISYSFVMAFREDPLVYEITSKLGPEYIKDLGIHWIEGSNMIPVQVEGRVLAALSEKVKQISDDLMPVGLFHGSNSWIIAPEKTRSGQAMLVNDPHIGFVQPAIWYEAHLKCPGFEIYGHYMPLLTTAILGFNRDIAWGLTMFENDDMDFYLEKINPDNPNQYWAVDHWEDFKTRQEVIEVKGKADVVLSLRSSRHGPIITDAFDGFKDKLNPLLEIKAPLAMWWAFFDKENGMIQAFDELARSKTVDQAEKAVSQIHAPGLNIMYANKSGDIAWWAVGKLPIRPAHVNSKMILDGASGKDDIIGFHEFSKNPKSINPARNVIYTSNNQPADTGIGLIPGYYAPRNRAQRIEKYLYNDKMDWSADDMKKMLLDNVSPLPGLFQDIAVPVLRSNPAVQKNNISKKALEIFAQWQGNHDVNEAAVTIFYRFKNELVRQIMMDELGENRFQTMQSGFLLDRSFWKMLPNKNSVWWDNIATQNRKESAAEIIASAWLETTDYLQTKMGKNVDKWLWRKHVSLEHVHLLGRVKPLNKLFNVGPFPVPAGQEIINNLSIALEKGEFQVVFGPSTRRIIDFGEIDKTLGILPTGQSGNFMDPHYDDQAQMYVQGKYRRQYINREDIMANTEGKLLLLPE